MRWRIADERIGQANRIEADLNDGTVNNVGKRHVVDHDRNVDGLPKHDLTLM